MINSLTITLLLKERPVLLVGAGKVATRKIHNLLTAGIQQITVISPEATTLIQQLADSAKIKWIQRPFQETDCRHYFLIFAVTNDSDLNLRILQLAAQQGLLAGTVDDHWPQGDFITPALIYDNEIRVAISSMGTACRKTRMIKESIAKHMSRMDHGELMILGTDHNFLSLKEREPFHLLGEKLKNLGMMMQQLISIHEFVLLNTCNRIEILAIICPDPALEQILLHLTHFNQLSPSQFYVKTGKEAFQHFALTASGLFSQTPGENHITAQIKDAFHYASEQKWANGMMQEWLDSTLHISKHIRNKVAPLLKIQEIEELCQQYIEYELGSLKEKTVLVIGAGTVGKALVQYFNQQQLQIYWGYHVNCPKFSSDSSIHLFQIDAIAHYLPKADLLIVATNSDEFVIQLNHQSYFAQHHPILAIDLSIPRSIDPTLTHFVSSLHIVDLEDLKHWYRREACDLEQIEREAVQVVEEHYPFYDKLMYSFQGNNHSASLASFKKS